MKNILEPGALDAFRANPASLFTRRDEGATLLCFSHLRWNFVFQRPQHLLTRAAQTYQVLFMEEPIFQEMQAAYRLERHPQPSGVTVLVPVIRAGSNHEQVMAAQRAVVDEIVDSLDRVPDVFWYYTPMALAFSNHVEPGIRIYDCMDELSAFRGAPVELVEQEKALFACADLVFTGGQSLYESKRRRHHDVHAFPSSVDKAHFAQARGGELAEPADQAGIPGPRIGFFGVIDERMDVALVDEVARLRPDWQLIMIGPVVKIDPASLPKRPNVHWLGGKSYNELPAYLVGWDAAFMPFALNESTKFISPTKTPEFLAAGLPVVSTPITDVVRPYGEKKLVGIAATAAEMVAELDRALSPASPEWVSTVEQHLSQMSWDKTWNDMAANIDRVTRPVDQRIPA